MMNIAQARGRLRTAAAVITRWLASEGCFYVVLAGLILQALWFALSARYPMAFDENYHFGLIQLHAGQWLPFFTRQPDHSGAYGAIARDPSYLYHYLLSMPYRLSTLVTRNLTAQIVVLRVLNIALFASSFFLFRRLLVRLGSSRALAHTILLLFSLVPIVPFLAGQINYDNLLIPLMLWCLLATFDWLDDLKHARISARRTLVLLSVMLLTCLVKYVFLPVMAVLVAIMLWRLWHRRAVWPALGCEFLQSFRSLHLAAKLGVLLVACIALGLFTERYAVNLWDYHAPTPQCERILTLDQCMKYGPWQRDYLYGQVRPGGFKPDYRGYANVWVYWMWRRSFFTINYIYDNKHPLTVPGNTAAVLAVLGSGMFLGYAWVILRPSPYRRYVLLVTLVYTAALFAETLHGYLRTAQPVAINGRYLIPFMPLLMLFAGLSFREFLHKYPGLKALAAVLCVALFLQGGGVLTFIFQSEPSWDWQNRTVIWANDTARYVLRPLVYGSRRRDG